MMPAAAKSLQLCPTLSDPIDGNPLGSSVPGILQARVLEWVAISFSNAWKWKVKVKSLSLVRLLATPWTAAHQAPPSMGFSRQCKYYAELPVRAHSGFALWNSAVKKIYFHLLVESADGIHGFRGELYTLLKTSQEGQAPGHPCGS